MLRRASHRWSLRLAIGVLLGGLAWPREAVLGTYGSYTQARTGYTIAASITVGSMSEHSHEAELYREHEAEIDAQVRPQLALYGRWFERAFTQKHAYQGFLGALDRGRSTRQQWDYKNRLPAPLPRPAKPTQPVKGTPPTPPSPLAPLALPLGPRFGSARPIQIYLHMKLEATQLAQGRALVGFALAQSALGDGEDFRLPADGNTPLAQRLERAARGDSFRGQPLLLAALLFDVRERQAELARFAEDASQSAELRLLARLLLVGLRRESPTAADWQRFEDARAKLDRRSLWTWALVLTPTEEQAACEAELRKRLPLSDEDVRYYYREYVQGKEAKSPVKD